MGVTPEQLADKIARKATDTLRALDREMAIMKWPPEFRAIMWGAVAHEATIRATEITAAALDNEQLKVEK